MTPSLRLRLLEALEPFVREAFRYEPPEGDDDREAFETNLHIGQVRDLARLHDELKSSGPDTERRTRQLANEKEDRLHVGFGTSTVSQGATSVSNLDELKGGDASDTDGPTLARTGRYATPPPSASEPAGADKALGDLLAIIHRDGGHYQVAHGAKAAVEAAHKIWADLQTRAEASTEPAGAMEERIVALTAERDESYKYARNLLVAFVNKHCNPVPHFAPLSDLLGVLTQIDNAMTVTDRLTAELAEARKAMDAVIESATFSREFYERNGPTWTGADGHEYADMSEYLDKLDEIAAVARAFLSSHPEPQERAPAR